jgi:hypothetical protein
MQPLVPREEPRMAQMYGGPPMPVRQARLTTIESDPPGAQVFRNGVLLGTTPLAVSLPSEPQELSLRLRGYRSRSLVLSSDSAEMLSVRLERVTRIDMHPPPRPLYGGPPGWDD